MSVPRFQRHDDFRHCGLVQLESGPAVVGPTAKIYDLGALGCRVGGLDGLHDVEPVLVKKERVFAEQLVEFCNDSLGITLASNWPKVRWTCAELSFIAHSFSASLKGNRRRDNRGVAGLASRGRSVAPAYLKAQRVRRA